MTQQTATAVGPMLGSTTFSFTNQALYSGFSGEP